MAAYWRAPRRDSSPLPIHAVCPEGLTVSSPTSRRQSMLKNNSTAAFFLAIVASGLGLLAVLLAVALRLEACHLCIFQRILYFVIGASFFVAFLVWERHVPRLLALVSAGACSLWGICVAAKQSWLQWFPASGFTCSAIEPSFTEHLVDWLGELSQPFSWRPVSATARIW